jgi:predicted RNA-binding protein (virulence factor B family)
MNGVELRAGTPVVVEVINFGPLGASVHVIGIGEHLDGSNDNLPPWFCETERTLAKGIILQGEIHLFRQSRRYIDVRRGEVLNAYVERIRNVDSSDGLLKLDICLRSFGSLSKANEASNLIWNRLQQLQCDTNWPHVSLPIGTRSRREEIGRFFPGMSKVTFKRAVAVLEEREQLEVNDYSIRLVDSGAVALTAYHP